MVMNSEIAYLCAHFRQQAVVDSWKEAMKRLCQGDCPWAEQVMLLLLQTKLSFVTSEPKSYGRPGARYRR